MARTAFQPTDWSESAQATDNPATATHAGEAGSIHYVTDVMASFTGGSDTGDLTVKDGSTTLVTFSVHGDATISFTSPLQLSEGADAVAEIGAGGGSVVGNVAILDFTLEA